MDGLPIRKYPDPILRKKARRVERVTDLERKLLLQMADTMYLNSGVGLAANQVGIDKQLVVIDIGSGLIKLINPVIIRKNGSAIQEEGCLSVPENCIKIKRAKEITVKHLDDDGKDCRLRADGLLARAIQHEVDHLSGKLIIDYLNPIKRLFLKKRCSLY
jgi:peptide deformylase